MKQTVDWHSHWRQKNPGFHEGRVNAWLEEFLPRFALQPGDEVFVPLCGKAVDMRWLLEQGYRVTGVELSQVAVEAFFKEASLAFTRHETGPFAIYQGPGITLYQGDFTQLKAEHLASTRLVYDRAAIVAIEPFNRAAYHRKMLQLIPAGTPMLMVAMEYDQGRMQGPPFSVPVAQVRALYEPEYQVEVLASADLIDEQPRWRERGLTSLVESVLALTSTGVH